eukprot:4251560-Pleurochrysis_carterae.AAC.3
MNTIQRKCEAVSLALQHCPSRAAIRPTPALGLVEQKGHRLHALLLNSGLEIVLLHQQPEATVGDGFLHYLVSLAALELRTQIGAPRISAMQGGSNAKCTHAQPRSPKYASTPQRRALQDTTRNFLLLILDRVRRLQRCGPDQYRRRRSARSNRCAAGRGRARARTPLPAY